MGTRSDIIVVRADGKVARVYCHWDGYLSHNGACLQKHYNKQELAEELVSHGDMSLLDSKCSKPKGHTYDTPKKGYTVYYGRDRGEADTNAKIFGTLDAAWPRKDSWTEFTYVWKDGKWWVGSPPQPSSLRPLADALANVTDE